MELMNTHGYEKEAFTSADLILPQHAQCNYFCGQVEGLNTNCCEEKESLSNSGVLQDYHRLIKMKVMQCKQQSLRHRAENHL
jgi:hypothetical protein